MKHANVLIVTTSPSNADRLGHLCLRAVEEVTLSFDAYSGFEEALNPSTSMIIVDHSLGHYSGRDFVNEVRKHSKVPILLLTEGPFSVAGVPVNATLPSDSPDFEILQSVNYLMKFSFGQAIQPKRKTPYLVEQPRRATSGWVFPTHSLARGAAIM